MKLFARYFLLCATIAAGLVADAQSRFTVSYPAAHSHRHTGNEAYLAESVDVQPEFPGGDAALVRYINSVRQYPRDAYSRQIQGRVLCSFIVETDGSISNIDIVRGVDDSLNREALRVISTMPKWKAGRIGDTTVPVFYILPIPFRL